MNPFATKPPASECHEDEWYFDAHKGLRVYAEQTSSQRIHGDEEGYGHAICLSASDLIFSVDKWQAEPTVEYTDITTRDAQDECEGNAEKNAFHFLTYLRVGVSNEASFELATIIHQNGKVKGEEEKRGFI